MSEYTIRDLDNIIKVARENAICGYYQTSLEKFAIAILIIQNRINELTEESIKLTELWIWMFFSEIKSKFIFLISLLINNNFNWNNLVSNFPFVLNLLISFK